MAQKFTLKIDLTKAGLSDHHNFAALLHKIAREFDIEKFSTKTTDEPITAVDVNGTLVGNWIFE